MIPALILWLISQYRKAGSRRQFFMIILNKINSRRQRLTGIVLIVLLLFIVIVSGAQTRNLEYSILRGADNIGTIHFSETSTSDTKQLNMDTRIKTKIFLISYSGIAREEARYRNGVLCYSSIYRVMNGKEKANKQHQAENNQYLIQAGKKSEVTNAYPITYNMLNLYSTEPVGIHKVYSDNFQQFLDIKKIEEHKYKISLPDGTTNYYSYSQGVMVSAESHSTWYSVVVMLNK